MDQTNVHPLRPKNPLFPARLRTALESGAAAAAAPDPQRLVESLEDAFCAWLVFSVRQVVAKVFAGTGRAPAAKVS